MVASPSGFCFGEMVVKEVNIEWVDIHTHQLGKGISVWDPCLGDVELSAESVVYRSLGIHPKFIDEHTEERLLKIEQEATDGRIVAIGEAGLDRNVAIPMVEQEKWFKAQAQLAQRYRLPLLIHGVRTIPEIIALSNCFRGEKAWIMHGFNNRKELLIDLLKHGFYISVGRYVLNQDSPIYQNLLQIPDDRLFLETDDASCSIEEVYRAVAWRKGISVEELKRVIYRNFERLFIH